MPTREEIEWIIVHDEMPEHPKIDPLSDASFRFMIELWCYCSRQNTADVPLDVWRTMGSPSSRRGLIKADLVRIGETSATVEWLCAKPVKRRRRLIPEAVRNLVYDRDGRRCLHCGRRDRLSLDHIKAWSRGGSDEPWNLQTLCQPCNSRKWAH